MQLQNVHVTQLTARMHKSGKMQHMKFTKTSNKHKQTNEQKNSWHSKNCNRKFKMHFMQTQNIINIVACLERKIHNKA